ELYKAMSSIEDALALRHQLLEQETLLREGLELAKKSERLNEVRYRQGAVRISFWLDAQEKRRQAELALYENRFNQVNNLAQIYMEFGGTVSLPGIAHTHLRLAGLGLAARAQFTGHPSPLFKPLTLKSFLPFHRTFISSYMTRHII